MAPSANPLARLRHIRDEIAWMVPLRRTMTYERFVADIVIVRAVERGLLIISEAVKALPEPLLQRHPEIPWHEIKAIGNILRHQYADVAPEILWDILHAQLTELEHAVDTLIRSIEPS